MSIYFARCFCTVCTKIQAKPVNPPSSQRLQAQRRAPTRMRSLARDEERAYLCSKARKARESLNLAVARSGTRCSRKQAQTTTRWCVVQVAQM